MRRVSLILPTSRGEPFEDGLATRMASKLSELGFEIELLRAVGDDHGPIDSTEVLGRLVRAPIRGSAAAAIAGLEAAEGDVLVVLETSMGYDPDDLALVVEAVAEGRAELVVASRLTRGTGPFRTSIGALVRPLVGTSDPLSGLVALDRRAFDEARGQFAPIGSKFAFELLSKIAAGPSARRLDLPIRRRLPKGRGRFGIDDVRHLKRLSDHRFGNISRLLQFCVVGASGAVVDLTIYAALQALTARSTLATIEAPIVGGPLHLALSGLAAVTLAVVWNFLLNRRLTFNDARNGSALHQFARYVLSNALSVPLSLYLRLWLPQASSFFGRHKLSAAVVGIAAGTVLSFSMSRWLVFRRVPDPAASAEPLRPMGRRESRLSPDPDVILNP